MTKEMHLEAARVAADPNLFLSTVAKMRAAQKKYFRTRDREVLLESIHCEQVVDQALILLGIDAST